MIARSIYSAITSILVLSVTSTLQAAPPSKAKVSHVELEGKLLCIPAETANSLGLTAAIGAIAPREGAIITGAKLERILAGSASGELLSVPSVTTKSGERCIVEIIRELRYPTEYDGGGSVLTPAVFETRNLGLTAMMFPDIRKDGAIQLELTYTISYLDGWAGYKDGKTFRSPNGAPPEGGRGFVQPIIGRTNTQTEVILRSGETLLLGGFPVVHPSQTGNVAEFDPLSLLKLAPFEKPMLQFAFVTARVVDMEAMPQNNEVLSNMVEDAFAVPPPSSSTGKLPYGILTDKPGFVRSPYAPNEGYVDLRGFQRGMEVKDPYTGKVFLVP